MNAKSYGNAMAYDKKVFLSGLAAGRNMKSWPAMIGAARSASGTGSGSDYTKTFLSGLQLGRRLKIADALRRETPTPVPAGMLILSESGIPIVTEHISYDTGVTFFDCNVRYLRTISQNDAYYYEMTTNIGDDGVRFFYANMPKDTEHTPPQLDDPPQIVFVKNNLSGGSYIWWSVVVNQRTGAETRSRRYTFSASSFHSAMGKTDRGYAFFGYGDSYYPPGEIDFFDGTIEELEAFVASAGYKNLITEGEVSISDE